MVTSESGMENGTEVSSFLLMVLDRGNQWLQEGSVTDEYKNQMKNFELVEDTTRILETFLGASNSDRNV